MVLVPCSLCRPFLMVTGGSVCWDDTVQGAQWQPPPLPMRHASLAHHLGPRSPLIPEPQRVLPLAPPQSLPPQAPPQQSLPPLQRPKPTSLALSRVTMSGDCLAVVDDIMLHIQFCC